jgi:hypothetical protein
MAAKHTTDTPAPPATDNSAGAEGLAKTTKGVPADLLTDMATSGDRFVDQGPLDLDFLLESDPDGWTPREGDKLVGRVLNIETGGQGSQYGSYPLLLIRRDGDGQLVNVHAFHTVLRTELGRKAVGVGDRIGIKYMGLADGGDFGTYENYRVVTEPAPGKRLSVESVAR